MKLGIAIATEDALPSAFVVFRDDLCRSIDRSAQLGFHGVELALRDASQVDVRRIDNHLRTTGLEIPCISSGQVFAADHLYFTHPDAEVRKTAVERIIGFIRLAAHFRAKVNTGRVRGFIQDGEAIETATRRYLDCLNWCADVAEPLGVDLIIEPVNRYEVNFVNTCAEAMAIIQQAKRPCIKLMPDLFHMNIEESSFRGSLESAQHHIGYMHIADSNRLAPGWGHIPFEEVFQILSDIGYDGYLTIEILPVPDPGSAALQAAEYILPKISRSAN
jgi:sugar phosphate isomerase/epimerase